MHFYYVYPLLLWADLSLRVTCNASSSVSALSNPATKTSITEVMLPRGIHICPVHLVKSNSLPIPKHYRLKTCHTSTTHFEYRTRSKPGWTSRRTFSTGRIASESPIKVSHVLGTLLVFGVGATAWGLYEFYMTLTMWPMELRGDLRAGLKAKNRGDLKLAQRHLTRAWMTIQSLSQEALAPDAYLKLSGVAVILAEVLEADQQLEQAYDMLKASLNIFERFEKPIPAEPNPSAPSTDTPSSSKDESTLPSSEPLRSKPTIARRPLSYFLDTKRLGLNKSKMGSRSRKRAAAIALKLGDLAEVLSRPEEEERWLCFAVAEVLRVLRIEYGITHDVRNGFVHNRSDAAVSSSDKQTEHEKGVRDILSPDTPDGELGLPSWVSLTKSELAAPMERLGAFYARRGEVRNAILLYRVASSLLVRAQPNTTPSNDRKQITSSSVTELCQALQIENAHMALLMDVRRSHPESEAAQRDLPRVMKRAISIYDAAVRKHGRGQARDDGIAADSEIALCDQTYPAILFNAGVYYEEDGQLEQALRSFSLSYMALRSHGSREMMQEALENVRRLQRTIEKNTREASQKNKVPTDTAAQTNDPESQTNSQ
ncbi:uncharacterized protein FOMMEDRAFT_170567 [Fomitiporia mediterranea MF3/22]|uniref:uncharacterized protein n=1 Tax=Fomitiporia mediterranea (strain MF3/22) TaxID=694068 RepID=UPI0004407E3D|nr:uncharacterized protein FOMMEDRAFT_170567 [Fomitiporia mediterranea MF3/22]EJC99248.1 hypothetical protein FOMMEDRAFT_170567 [Fomitiporia mediterranea MF3/22]